MNKHVKTILRNLIIGLVITGIAAGAFQLYYGSTYTLGVIVIGVVSTILISKAYLLLLANTIIEGTVIKCNVKMYSVSEPQGKQQKSYSYKGGVVGSYKALKVAVVVKTINGRRFLKRFKYTDENDVLPIGTKIRFTIFDDEPEIIS